jgi:hydrogenase maturation factor HypE
VLTDVTVEGATGVAIEMTVAGSEDVRVGEVSTTVAAITTAITATQAPITATMIGHDRRDESWCSDDG